MGGEQGRQLAEHHSPRGDLGRGVLNPGDGIPCLVGLGNPRDFLAPLPVDGIGESWVIRIQFLAIRENLLSELIKVRELPGEPRDYGEIGEG